MNAASANSRHLLRQIRQIMAGPLDAQARLDSITSDIAQSMAAQVCSVYVLRADRALELFATEGLNSEAVHKSS